MGRFTCALKNVVSRIVSMIFRCSLHSSHSLHHIVYKLLTGIVSAPEMDEYDMRVCLTSNFKVCDVFVNLSCSKAKLQIII